MPWQGCRAWGYFSLPDRASQILRLRYGVPDTTSQVRRLRYGAFNNALSETLHLRRLIWDALVYCSRGLNPVSLTSFAQRSRCSTSHLPNSGGLMRSGVVPWAASFSFMSERPMMRFTSALTFVMTSGGVFAGARMPCHEPVTKPSRPGVSPTVGTSGSAGSRFALDTASALTLPLFTCAIDCSMPRKRMSHSPVRTWSMDC